jgi:hypothetical protein
MDDLYNPADILNMTGWGKRITPQQEQPSWFQKDENQPTIDMLSFGLDKLGQFFDPNNPFAGAGSGMAQGRVMQRARKPMEDKEKYLNAMIQRMLSGDITPTDKEMGGLNEFSVKPHSSGNGQVFSMSANMMGPRKSNLPFADSPQEASPEPKGLYQPDPNLSWRQNVDRAGENQDLRNLMKEAFREHPQDPAEIILSAAQQKQLSDEKRQLGMTTNALMKDAIVERRNQNAMKVAQMKAYQDAIKAQRKEAQDEKELAWREESHNLTVKLQKGNISKQKYEEGQRDIEDALKEQRLVTGDVDLAGKLTENQNRIKRGKKLDFETDPTMLELQRDYEKTKVAKGKEDLAQIGKKEQWQKDKVKFAANKEEQKRSAKANAVPMGEPASVNDVHQANMYQTKLPILTQISEGTDSIPKVGDAFLWSWKGDKEKLNTTANMNTALTKRIHEVLKVPEERHLTIQQHAKGVKMLNKAGEIALEQYDESTLDKWKKKFLSPKDSDSSIEDESINPYNGSYE